MLEEVINSFFFHQAAGKREVGFAILHAVVALIIGSRKFVRHVQAGQNLAEYVRYREVLKNPAADVFRQQPEDRHDASPEVQEIFVARTLTETVHHPVEIPHAVIEQPHLNRDALPDDLIEADFFLKIGDQIDIEIERPRNLLSSLQSGDQQDIGA